MVGDSRLTAASAAADGDDEHDSLEGNGFGTNASSPTGNASTSSCSGSANFAITGPEIITCYGLHEIW